MYKPKTVSLHTILLEQTYVTETWRIITLECPDDAIERTADVYKYM